VKRASGFDASAGAAADGHVDCRSDRTGPGHPMRIAYVTETYPPEVNGVALTAARAVAYLRQRGHAVDVIRPHQAHEAVAIGRDEWRTRGCPLPMYADLRFGLATAGALKRRFEASGVDLVHVATPGPLAWQAVRAARALGLASSAEFRTNFHQYLRYYHLGLLAPLGLRVLRRLHNAVDRTFVPTRALERELSAAGFERLSVVGRGVDTSRFSPRRRSVELRREWGVPDDAPLLLYVGRVAAEKNVGLALDAFAAASAASPTAHFVVVGDGPQRESLERMHPDVRFVGARHGELLAACYASADLFVFPSLTDTFGNVTLEALASGLPVLAFDVAAAAEHVGDGVSGRLVRPGDDVGFAAALRELVVAPERLAAMRGPAVDAARRATWDEVLGRFEAQLQDTLHAHEAPLETAPVVA
jgi:glycosyltransferase involved in cell wall biosynthesis